MKEIHHNEADLLKEMMGCMAQVEEHMTETKRLEQKITEISEQIKKIQETDDE